MFILVMMQVMVSPEWFHPFKRRVPGMDGIVHGTIHQVTQQKTGEEHECITTDEQIGQSKQSG